MKQFNDFLIRLQTFDVKIRDKAGKDISDRSDLTDASYDLSNENPFLSVEFNNELKILREKALTDLLTLPKEQVHFQITRLKSIHELFNQFWKRYYATTVKFSVDGSKELWEHIALHDIFIVQGYHKNHYSHIEIKQQLLDDLTDSIQAREGALGDLINMGLDAIADDGHTDPQTATMSESSTLRGDERSLKTDTRPFNFSSEQAMMDFHNIVQGWFSDGDKSKLLDILKSNPDSDGGNELLIFHGNGNQLADAFKQMFEGNLIVGCSKQALQNWIAGHFLYRDKDKPKPYNEKYLSDIISSTVRECQSPILEVKKKNDGHYGVFPTYRTTKNYKK